MNMTGTLKESEQKLEELKKRLKSLSESFTGEKFSKQKEELLNLAEETQKIKDKIEQARNFTYFGQSSGGKRKSQKKSEAVRENGKKGGRPSKKSLVKIEKFENQDLYTIVFSDQSTKSVEAKSLLEVRALFPISRYKWSEELERAYNSIFGEELF